MNAISKIVARVATADVPYAATASRVYLGIAGREFRLARGTGDFARGAEVEFVLGQDTNVRNPEHNDPRLSPVLDMALLDHHPVYVRMEEDGAEPAWCLDHVLVTVNPGRDSRVYGHPSLEGFGPEHRVWFEEMRGTTLYLSRAGESPPQPQPQSQSQSPAPPTAAQPQATPQLTDELIQELKEELKRELSQELKRESAASALRIVHGSVRADGRVEGESSDFAVQRVALGTYTIRLRQPFAAAPTATALVSGRAWRLLDNAHVVRATPQEVEICTGDDRGNRADRDFHFQIVEQPLRGAA
ncbi:hypothetical protein ACWC10_25795 [Streptomyces sp. NPDC001595]|uniref:hypothetical protein n=1 Tax=Streptomyces sp. NPDC001532 TaxID=3154520 RepID=UPI00332D5A86